MRETHQVIHLVDGDGAIRDAVAFLLIGAGHAVRVHDSGQGFLAGTAQDQRTVVIAGPAMRDLSGLELLRSLKARPSRSAAIMISGQGDVAAAVDAMKAGAMDFLQKPFSDDDLLRAVAAAHQHVSQDGPAKADTAENERLRQLTRREREVLDGLIEGLPNKLIAARLNISPRTVEIHRANLMAKLQVKTLPQLVRMFVDRRGKAAAV